MSSIPRSGERASLCFTIIYGRRILTFLYHFDGSAVRGYAYEVRSWGNVRVPLVLLCLASSTSTHNSPRMPHRAFTDSEGTLWEVWQITPSSVKSAGRERRATVDPALEQGWLCFESKSGDKRRLAAPIPLDWESFSEERIRVLCTAAAPVKKSAS